VAPGEVELFSAYENIVKQDQQGDQTIYQEDDDAPGWNYDYD
jgi:hypothetical protein